MSLSFVVVRLRYASSSLLAVVLSILYDNEMLERRRRISAYDVDGKHDCSLGTRVPAAT